MREALLTFLVATFVLLLVAMVKRAVGGSRSLALPASGTGRKRRSSTPAMKVKDSRKILKKPAMVTRKDSLKTLKKPPSSLVTMPTMTSTPRSTCKKPATAARQISTRSRPGHQRLSRSEGALKLRKGAVITNSARGLIPLQGSAPARLAPTSATKTSSARVSKTPPSGSATTDARRRAMAAAKSMNLMLMMSPPSAELKKELGDRSANAALPRSAYEQPKADAPQPSQTVLRVPGSKSSPLAALSVRQALAVERAGTHGESRSSPGDLLSQPSLCERITTNDATESQYWKSLQKLYEHIRENDIPDPATPLELGLCVLDYIDFLFVTSENTSPPSVIVAAIEKLVPRILEMPHICKRIHKAIAGWVKRAPGSERFPVPKLAVHAVVGDLLSRAKPLHALAARSRCPATCARPTWTLCWSRS